MNLILPWNDKVPDDFAETGYYAYINFPFTPEKMRALFEKAKQNLSN